ncbi:hypothetical protein GGR25_000297 [Kaistia hirudinis]|uniref:Uncharacterized protein n=1 Tax=Kaistia hirudinis TaxID=1293440 RepID=A0A840AIM3_9HYPH|nr:hypothetical protein [Kaistia hirudinis]MBB3929278.1 hypothetical protein [Kaistia hirudinis]
MLLDVSQFPLVFLREHEEKNSSVGEVFERNAQLEALLNRQEPFVLIADHAAHDHDHETPEERKGKALFFKRIKDRMRQYCLGLIVIEGASPFNSATRTAATAVSNALGFSVRFAADEQSAIAIGGTMLKKNPA